MTKRYHIYIEYHDHRETPGNVRGDRKVWQVAETAKSCFRAAEAMGKKPVDWVVETDDHKVVCWGTDGPAHYEGI